MGFASLRGLEVVVTEFVRHLAGESRNKHPIVVHQAKLVPRNEDVARLEVSVRDPNLQELVVEPKPALAKLMEPTLVCKDGTHRHVERRPIHPVHHDDGKPRISDEDTMLNISEAN